MKSGLKYLAVCLEEIEFFATLTSPQDTELSAKKKNQVCVSLYWKSIKSGNSFEKVGIRNPLENTE